MIADLEKRFLPASLVRPAVEQRDDQAAPVFFSSLPSSSLVTGV